MNALQGDEYASRREVDQALEAHRLIHEQENVALGLALQHEAERETQHREAHEDAHKAHDEKHIIEGKAVTTALEAVNRERSIYAQAHEREHLSGQLAIDKAEQANDRRFSSVNATREQMSDILRTLATKESVDSLAKLVQDRYETNRASIVNLEKGDVKTEGKEMGRNTMVAIIVTAVTLVGTIVSAFVIIANFATKVGP